MNWNDVIDESELAAALPCDYARFVRPVREALVSFLNGFPAIEQAALMRAQAALGRGAPLVLRLGCLARMSPVLHKLGQVLARDQRLDSQLRTELQQLEWLPPQVSRESIATALYRELGPLEAHQIELGPAPLAEASVAVVIPFAHGAERASSPESWPHVFKLLKPDIERTLERELQLLVQVGERLDDRCQALELPPLDYAEIFRQVADHLRQEMRLDREQVHLQEAAEIYAGDARVQVPKLRDPCTPRVTAMERIWGTKLDASLLGSPTICRYAADLAIDSLVVHPFLSVGESALFHGDPHAGNLFWTREGRLALLDWSLIGRLSERHRQTMARIPLAAMALNCEMATDLVSSLCNAPPSDPRALRDVVEGSLRQVSRGRLPTLGWLVDLLDQAAQRGRLKLPIDLLLFRKVLLTLEGVAADLTGELWRADRRVVEAFARQFAAEMPWRWLRPTLDRSSPTGLSNADLWEAGWGCCTSIATRWAQLASRGARASLPGT